MNNSLKGGECHHVDRDRAAVCPVVSETPPQFEKTDRISVGASPRKNTLGPSARYDATMVDQVERYGLSGKPGGVLCIRVFTTSNGKVTSQPATPAIPPATSIAVHEWVARVDSTSFPGESALS